MEIINKCLNKKEFSEYIENKNITREIDKIILHHAEDTVEQWERGEISCLFYKKMYEEKGWESGPHLFVATEGVWLFTDIDIQGRHSNEGNSGSVGVEMVGNFDEKLPSGEVWENTKVVLKVLLKKFNLKPEDIHFHREYNPNKSCPGNIVTKEWISSMLN